MGLLAVMLGLYPHACRFIRPTLFLDKENRVVGWRTGVIGGQGNSERWEKKTQDLTTALEELAGSMASRRGQAPGVARGEHSWAHWGYSYGGGQQVRAASRLAGF